jgi:hypothetical protein
VPKLIRIFSLVNDTIVGAGTTSLTFVANEVSICASELVKLNGYTYEGVSRFKAALDNLSSANVQGVIDTFSGKADRIAGSMSTITTAMTTALTEGKGDVVEAINSICDDAASAADTYTKEFGGIGADYAQQLSAGISENSEDAKSKGSELGTKAASGARTGYSGMYRAGKYLVEGFAAGIRDFTYLATEQAKLTADATALAAQLALDINSPSKVFREIGYSVPEGFALGINKLSSLAVKSSTDMADNAIDSVKTSIMSISDIISSDIDAQPTIRPVLDLSDVRAGAGSIGSLFNTNPMLNATSNASLINTMMNRHGQNGVNGDIVSAINQLRKDLSSMGNTTYSINGITYDDGSNVATAVRELVRAARTERRV